jgi:hypothetical protein
VIFVIGSGLADLHLNNWLHEARSRRPRTPILFMVFSLEISAAKPPFHKSERDPMNACINAVGTLAQVVHIITQDDRREETLQSMWAMLQTYLAVLDDVRGPDPSMRA